MESVVLTEISTRFPLTARIMDAFRAVFGEDQVTVEWAKEGEHELGAPKRGLVVPNIEYVRSEKYRRPELRQRAAGGNQRPLAARLRRASTMAAGTRRKRR